MPFVLTSRVDPEGGFNNIPNALDPRFFEVEVGPNGETVTPVCATLQPTVEAGELRTVLLAGDFGIGGENSPTKIKIVGDLQTDTGESLAGIEIDEISSLESGPTLVLAELFDVGDSRIDTSVFGDGTQGAFCPAGSTDSVLKLTFSGGVSAANGGALAGNQQALQAVEILAVNRNGNRIVIAPFALRDDDNDNHLDLCLGGPIVNALQLIRVSVDSHNFFAPQNVPNKAATVEIIRP